MLQLREALARAIAGGALALTVSIVARRRHSLTMGGAVTAAMVGTLAITAGWSWGFLLCAFFTSATALSRLGAPRKAELSKSVTQKGAERDEVQVLANGGVFALSALGFLLVPSPMWYATAIGALAASTADTWATEVGTLSGDETLSIISGAKVAPGTSGGVTLIGTGAAVAGALFIASGAALASWPVPFAAAALGGIAGALTDSFLGATLQARRWCDVCAIATERVVHDCGTPTRHVGGIARLDNDAVNAVCSAVGALVAILLSSNR